MRTPASMNERDHPFAVRAEPHTGRAFWQSQVAVGRRGLEKIDRADCRDGEHALVGAEEHGIDVMGIALVSIKEGAGLWYRPIQVEEQDARALPHRRPASVSGQCNSGRTSLDRDGS